MTVLPPTSDEGPLRLVLPPEPASAGQARRWVGTTLDACDIDLVETAQLLVTELVTNAILYAGSDIEIGVEINDDAVRVEVADHSPVLPVIKDYGVGAMTGRGLGLVESMAAGWGIEPAPGGKVIWFDLRADQAGRLAAASGPLDLDRWPDLSEPAATPPPPDVEPELLDVHLLGIPLDLVKLSNAHGDALGREFRLILEQGLTDPDSVPVRLAMFVVNNAGRYSRFVMGTNAEAVAALERGDQTVDLHYRLPREAGEMAGDFARLLDEADVFCREGSLLTLAASPQVSAVRRWLWNEFADQLAGHAPVSWLESPLAKDLDQIDP